MAMGSNDSRIDCPLFQHFDELTLQCKCYNHCIPFEYDCSQQTLDIGMCASYSNDTGLLSVGYCPYELQLAEKISLDAGRFVLKLSVHSGEELNDAMCGPLNREGLLCGRCKKGHGVAPYSKTFRCVKCNDGLKVWMWFLYIFLETVPITLLYFLIIIFNVRATAPPFTSFLFHCQLMSFVNSIGVYRILIGYEANPALLHLTMAVLDMWNLDALRHLVPLFCISSSLTNFQVQIIRLIATLYPLLLVSVSYILIELHARNCRVIVFLWRPFHKCFVLARRKWDPRASNITAFSTLVLVTVLKLWFTALYTTYQNSVRQGDCSEPQDKLYIDPYIAAHTAPDLPWTLLCGLVVILLITVLLPSVTLCLYPAKVCRKVFFCCKRHSSHTLRVFVETFQGHYKDGTNGTRDFRAVSSLVFILRMLTTIVLYPLNARSGPPAHSISITLVYFLVILALFYAIVQPCKEKCVNYLESVQYAFTGLSFLFLTTCNLNAHSPVNLRLPLANTFLVTQLIPSLAVLGWLMFKILKCSHVKLISKRIASKTPLEILPDRIINPNDYTPLL